MDLVAHNIGLQNGCDQRGVDINWMSKTASKGKPLTELMWHGDAAAKTNESAHHILTELTCRDIKVDELD